MWLKLTPQNIGESALYYFISWVDSVYFIFFISSNNFTKLLRVNWSHTITSFAEWKTTITIHHIRTVPLLFVVHLRYATLYTLNTIGSTCRHLYFHVAQKAPAAAPHYYNNLNRGGCFAFSEAGVERSALMQTYGGGRFAHFVSVFQVTTDE